MIPLFRPELPNVLEVLRLWQRSRDSGMLTNFGPNFHEASELLGSQYGGHWLPVSSGTAALEVMVSLLPEKVRRIAVPDFTFAATALAVLRAGRTPVIVSSGSHHLSMYEDVLSTKRRSFDAILAVAPFGYKTGAYSSMEMIARELDKPLLWDFAGAFPMMPSTWHRPVAYSLHAAKSLPIGEGGLIRLGSKWEFDRAKRIISFGFDSKKNSVDDRGFNGKLDEFHCAMLIAQLHRMDAILARQEKIKALIDGYNNDVLGLERLPFSEHRLGCPSIAALRHIPADRMVKAGAKRGIIFRPYYAPLLSKQKAFKDLVFLGPKSCPNLSRVVAFPSDVTQGEYNEVIACARAVIDGRE